jgi:hypothetical protein
MKIYTEDMYSALNSHNIANNCKFGVHGSVVPQNHHRERSRSWNLKMAAFTGADRARFVFWIEEIKSTTQVQKIFPLSVSQETSQ